MDTWEYKLIRFHVRGATSSAAAGADLPETSDDSAPQSLGRASATLNDLGAQGWEIVGAAADGYVLILKRKKQQPGVPGASFIHRFLSR